MNTKIYPRCDPSNPCKASHNVANKESFVSILIHGRPHLLLTLARSMCSCKIIQQF